MTWNRQHVEDEAKASGREFYLMGYNLINGKLGLFSRVDLQSDFDRACC